MDNKKAHLKHHYQRKYSNQDLNYSSRVVSTTNNNNNQTKNNNKRKVVVQFRCGPSSSNNSSSNGDIVYEFERIEDDRERKLYWYTQKELQDILVKAMTTAGQEVQEARKNGSARSGNMPSLRGLESLSKTSKDRKIEIALDRYRVINSYSKQERQNKGGKVDVEKIRKLYQSYTEIDIKRALAYGKIDYQESYCYRPEGSGNADPAKTKTKKKSKGILGFIRKLTL